MALTIVLSLSAAALWGTTDFLGGLTARQVRALTVVLWVNAVGLVAALTVVLATGAGLSGEGLAWGAAAGGVSAIGFASFYAALASGSMSIVAPITAAGAIVPAVVAIAGGAEIAFHVAIGMALALSGAILAARAPSTHVNATQGSDPGVASTSVDATRALSARTLTLAVVAAIAIGGTLTLLQQSTDSSGTDPLAAVATSRVFGLIVIGLFVALARAPARVPAANVRAVVLVGLGDTAANVLFVLASDAGNDAVAAVFSSLYPVTTVLLARSLLHERISRVQAIGVAIALAGVALVSAG